MNPEKVTKDKRLEADVLVLGGGAAGLSAAVAAAEKGASAIVVEKRSEVGGNAAIRAKEIPAVESPVQKRELIDVTREALFKKVMKNCRWDCDPRVVRAIIDISGDTIRWLEDMGLTFRIIRIHPDEDMVVFHKIVTASGGDMGGEMFVKVMKKRCGELGVKLLCDTTPKKILTGAQGEVTGVLAAASDGNEVSIKAKSVVVATGGYSANRKLMEKHPHYHSNFISIGLPYDGDGIAMATEAGADTAGLGEMGIFAPTGIGHTFMSLEVAGKQQRVALMAVAQEPYTMWVNKKGKRFVDEVIGYNHYASAIPVSRQPEGLSFTIFDTDILSIMSEKGFIIGLTPHIEDWFQQRDGNLGGLESELRKLADAGAIKISDSLDEIAGWIGAAPGVLRATVDEYNAICEDGYDPVFAKERRYLLPVRRPPYYALRCQVGILHTMGGIKVDEKMQALDKEDEPVPGLYAAGMETGGWEKVHLDWLVGPMTVAVGGGRIAGENAARYAQSMAVEIPRTRFSRRSNSGQGKLIGSRYGDASAAGNNI